MRFFLPVFAVVVGLGFSVNGFSDQPAPTMNVSAGDYAKYQEKTEAANACKDTTDKFKAAKNAFLKYCTDSSKISDKKVLDDCVLNVMKCTQCVGDISKVPICGGTDDTPDKSKDDKQTKSSRKKPGDSDDTAQYVFQSQRELNSASSCPVMKPGSTEKLEKQIKLEQDAINKAKDNRDKLKKEIIEINNKITEIETNYQNDKAKADTDNKAEQQKAGAAKSKADADNEAQLQAFNTQINQANLSILNIRNQTQAALNQAEQGCEDSGLKALSADLEKRKKNIADAVLQDSAVDIFNLSGTTQQQKNANDAYRWYQACMTGGAYLHQVDAILRQEDGQIKAQQLNILDIMQKSQSLEKQMQTSNSQYQQAMATAAQKYQDKIKELGSTAQQEVKKQQDLLNQIQGDPNQPADFAAQLKQQLGLGLTSAKNKSLAAFAGKNLNGEDKASKSSELGQLDYEITGRQMALNQLEDALTQTDGKDEADKGGFGSALNNLTTAAEALGQMCQGDISGCSPPAQPICKENAGLYEQLNDSIALAKTKMKHKLKKPGDPNATPDDDDAAASGVTPTGSNR